jgi:hypothetical protein
MTTATRSLLPCVKLSDSLRRAGFKRVAGYGPHTAEIRSTQRKCGVSVDVDVDAQQFSAALLNDWDDSAAMYLSSSSQEDQFSSESWDELVKWIKQSPRRIA